MILLMPPYATTAAMVGEVDFAMVVVTEEGEGPVEVFFLRYQFHARHGIELIRTGSCVLGLLPKNKSAKRYL
ncbi:MAG: hypothetical protein GY874_18590 [Desulfobacteraceae bacterium]|nr:hypothetical protein [Desulfobacteraceae bacterium]